MLLLQSNDGPYWDKNYFVKHHQTFDKLNLPVKTKLSHLNISPYHHSNLLNLSIPGKHS